MDTLGISHPSWVGGFLFGPRKSSCGFSGGDPRQPGWPAASAVSEPCPASGSRSTKPGCISGVGQPIDDAFVVQPPPAKCGHACWAECSIGYPTERSISTASLNSTNVNWVSPSGSMSSSTGMDSACAI